MFGLIRNQQVILLSTGLFSLLLSWWIAAHETVLNSDAICYLQSAADMKLGLSTAMHLCDQAKWPFYSLLIYFFNKLTHFSLATSAFSINAGFSLLSSLMFLTIIRTITPNTRVLLCGAIVILFSHEFNSVKQYIIRDHGFWALYLTSIYFLIKYFKEKKWAYAFAWSVSTILATLFRVEGIIFLLFIPFLSFFEKENPFKCYLQLNFLMMMAAVFLVSWVFFHPQLDLARLYEVKFQFSNAFSEIIKKFFHLKLSLAEAVLGPDSARDAGMVLFIMLFSWFQVSIILNVSVIFFILVAYSWYKKSMPANRDTFLVLWGYLIINLIVTLVFFCEHLFLSKRYLIALSLVLMLWVPFALNDLIQDNKNKFFFIASFFIFISALGGIFNFGYSKQYIRDAGDWLALNAPTNANIYSNDYQVLYYSNHFGDDLFAKAKAYGNIEIISNYKWKQFDYVALNIRKKDDAKKFPMVGYTLAKTFNNKRGDAIVIYMRNSK